MFFSQHYLPKSTIIKQEKIVEVKDLRQTIAIEMDYGEANAWLEWINYSFCMLHKMDCYACAAGRPEPQVVPFPLGWATDPAGMTCMIAFFHERTAGVIGLAKPCHYCSSRLMTLKG
jgi:hypothetical protein